MHMKSICTCRPTFLYYTHTLVPALCIHLYELQDQESATGHPSTVHSAFYISLQLSWLVVYHAAPWPVLTELFSHLPSAVPRSKNHHTQVHNDVRQQKKH